MDALFGSLPAVVPVRASSDQAPVLRWALDLFAKEIGEGKPGGSLSAEHLAHIMLIQVLRLHLSAKENLGTGWLIALNDPQLSAATSAMHENLARRWTLEELAKVAGMSRSSFPKSSSTCSGTARWSTSPVGECTLLQINCGPRKTTSPPSPTQSAMNQKRPSAPLSKRP